MKKISLKNSSAFLAARNTILVFQFGPRVIKSGHPCYIMNNEYNIKSKDFTIYTRQIVYK